MSYFHSGFLEREPHLDWPLNIKKRVETFVRDKYRPEYQVTAINNYATKTKMTARIFLELHNSGSGLKFTEEELVFIRNVAGLEE